VRLAKTVFTNGEIKYEYVLTRVRSSLLRNYANIVGLSVSVYLIYVELTILSLAYSVGRVNFQRKREPLFLGSKFARLNWRPDACFC